MALNFTLLVQIPTGHRLIEIVEAFLDEGRCECGLVFVDPAPHRVAELYAMHIANEAMARAYATKKGGARS